MIKAFLVFMCLFTSTTHALERNLIIVTIDGLRWQEVFQGAQPTLANNDTYTLHKTPTIRQFLRDSPEEARERLMPFLWQTIANEGVLIGNRQNKSYMSVSNPWYFSYPGYSEIFTGVVNPNIDSNQKVANPEISFIEWLANERGYQHLAMFGSWDVFPYIFNVERSNLHVNAGFTPASGYPLSQRAHFLNQLQLETPSPWHNVRLDSFTYHFALDYLQVQQPRVMAIAFGETDDFAHDGRYDHYLSAANRTDFFIQQLWQTIQKMPQYRNNTNLLIVTDHGRGSNAEDWQHHASKRAVTSYMKNLNHFKEGIEGAEHIWMAALGPDVKPLGLWQTPTEIYQAQIATTALALLKEDVNAFNAKAASPIKAIIK